jgi:hypothetical protein
MQISAFRARCIIKLQNRQFHMQISIDALRLVKALTSSHKSNIMKYISCSGESLLKMIEFAPLACNANFRKFGGYCNVKPVKGSGTVY